MSAAWILTLSTGAINVAMKSSGVLFFRSSDGKRSRILDVLTPTLLPAVLAALIAVQVFSKDGRIVLDARAVGLLTAVTAVRLRFSPVFVLLSAALATAVIRLIRY